MRHFITFICGLLMTAIAFAQDIDTTTVYTIDEINVVGFYRTDTKVGNVLDRDFIGKANKGQEPSFILSNMPSVFSYSDTGSEYGYSYFRMRGMDQTRVNMSMDGMPLNEGEDMGVYFSNYPDMLSSIHSTKVESGSSITGNGSAGYAGSIDFESINLKKDTQSMAYFGYGNFNTLKSSVEYNSGLVNKFAVHMKATHLQSDGYRENSYNNSQSFFIKAGYFFNDHHSLDILSFVGNSRNNQGWIGSTMGEIALNPRHNGCTDSENDHFIQNINKLQYKGFITDNVRLTSSVYYNWLSGWYNFDLDNFMQKMGDPSYIGEGEVDTYHLRHNMIGGNIAVKAYLNDFTITGGVNGYTFNRNHIGTSNIVDGNLWNNTGYKNDFNAFVKGEYSYCGFNVVGNIQYRHADFNYKGDKDFDKINWDFLNWSVNAKYKFNNSHELYAVATQVHREPTRSDMFGGEENFINLVTTQAESVIDYEFGYNITLDKFVGNINLYYMDFDNELILNGAYGTNGLPIRQSAANSYRTGVEVSWTYTPVKNLVLRNTTSYSINRIETDYEILTHIMSPNWLVNQNVDYTIGNFNIGANLKYISDFYFELSNAYKLEGSAKFGAYVYYTLGDITFGLKANNIFNKQSFSNGMMGAVEPLYFIDAPRTFFFDMRFNF